MERAPSTLRSITGGLGLANGADGAVEDTADPDDTYLDLLGHLIRAEKQARECLKITDRVVSGGSDPDEALDDLRAHLGELKIRVEYLWDEVNCLG